MALLHTSSVYDLAKLREGVERLAELSFERAIIYGKVRLCAICARLMGAARARSTCVGHVSNHTGRLCLG